MVPLAVARKWNSVKLMSRIDELKLRKMRTNWELQKRVSRIVTGESGPRHHGSQPLEPKQRQKLIFGCLVVVVVVVVVFVVVVVCVAV